MDESAIVRDADGNALGGVRSPIVQAPTATHSGTGNSGPSIVARGYLLPVDAADAIKTAGSAPIPA